MFPELGELSNRFWRYVAYGPDCWLWTGYRDPRWGYGRFHVGDRRSKRMLRAHRVAWLLTRGPIPRDLWVLHRCDVPPCVRPEHMFLGTHEDNMHDMAAKHRARVSRGMQNPHRRLVPEDVHSIRALYAGGGWSQERLGAAFGVRQTQVSRIVRGEAWREEG